MENKYVVSLFDYTGNMVRPWVENGYKAFLVDIQHEPQLVFHGNGVYTWGEDILSPHVNLSQLILNIFGNRPHMVFAFPPCTHLAVSGARWWASKGEKALFDALTLVRKSLEIMSLLGTTSWMLENPVGRLSKFWQKPDFTFQPYEYGGYLNPPADFYTKRTCIWCGGGFVKPTPKPVFPFDGSKMHRLPPSKERANLRSATPMGFAKAVYEANKGE